MNSSINFQYRVKFVSDELIEGVIWYKVSVTDLNNHKTFFINTRYSLLRILHIQIKETYSGNIPEFPPKKWFGNTEKTFVSQRKKYLENYLNTILKSTNLDKIPVLKEFLFVKSEKIKELTVFEEKKKENSEDPRNSLNLKNAMEKITDNISNKFLNISLNNNQPEEEDVKKKKYIYQKLKLNVQSDLLNNYKFPIGKETNTVVVKKESLPISELFLIQEADKIIKSLIDYDKEIENYGKSINFIQNII